MSNDPPPRDDLRPQYNPFFMAQLTRDQAKALASGIHDVLEKCGELLKPEQVATAEMLVNAHEFGVALEYVCDWLDELDVAVDAAIVTAIDQLGTKMQLDAQRWERLRR